MFVKGNELLLSKQFSDDSLHKQSRRQSALAAKSRLHMERSKRYAIVGLTTGILCGFLLCLWSKPLIQCTIHDCCLKKQLRAEIQHEIDSKEKAVAPQENIKRKKVLIGVMTAAKFLDNRALAVWKTWAQTINGDVIFFSSEDSMTKSDIPLVALPGVTDDYPPQKKSFMMIKYLHDFGKDKYDYFMRVDDDIYIHGERLDAFLDTLNSSQSLYIGQAGTGNAEEFGRLSLGQDENFCMGGPGIVFSGETLRKTVPHISYCLQNLLTSHEDVELGRCVQMFAGITCIWSYEMQKLFFHSYAYRTNYHVFPYVMTGPEIDRAVTLHPLKHPNMMYQLHNEMAIRRKATLELQKLALIKEIEMLNHSTETVHNNNNAKMELSTDDIPWTYITSHTQFRHNMFSVKRNHEGAWKEQLNKAMDFIISRYNTNALSKGRIVDQPEVIYGYTRFHPTNGVQLKLNVKMSYQQIRGNVIKTKVSTWVFLEIPLGTTAVREAPVKNDVIHLIMPLSGKLQELKRFLTQFEKVCAANSLCDLTIVLYRSEEYEDTVVTIRDHRQHHLIKVIEGQGSFSRAIALHQGIMTMKNADLVWFVDVDIYFDSAAVDRVQQHTIIYTQLYFPIVFNQYDSQMVCGCDSCPVEDQSPSAGSYRFFGFGIVSLYKADYSKSGGFDLGIHGWGKEDVDLYNKVLKSGLNAFRAADPGITHIYHPKICDSSLNEDQTTMCLNSKATSYASQQTLARLYFNSSRHSIS